METEAGRGGSRGAGGRPAQPGRILVEAHVTVSPLVTELRSLLEQPARRLLEKEVVERDELHALLSGAKLS